MTAPKPAGPGLPRAPPSQWAVIQVDGAEGSSGKRLGVGWGIVPQSKRCWSAHLPARFRVYLGVVTLTPESEEHEQ